MVNVTELRPNNYYLENGEIYSVLDVHLNKTAMRRMIVRMKVKNVRTGAITEVTYNSGHQMDRISIERRKMSYLYDDGTFLVFMDNENYEQISLPQDHFDWELKFLVPNSEVDIAMYEGEVLGVSLPPKVNLKITHCPPGVKGNTATGATKDATLETGLVIRVPLFIEEGEVISVKTDTGEYDGRA